MPLKQKEMHADTVLLNDGTINEFQDLVDLLRRLGETQTRTVALDEIVSALAVEATPPDLL